LDIFISDSPHTLIKNLKFGRVFFKKFPELVMMNTIYQDKRRNHSLFDHSLSVLKHAHKYSQYKSTLLAAFFHDFGKLFTYEDNFKKHDLIGVRNIGAFLEKYGVDKDITKEVKVIMTSHFRASQYQREPNWTEEAVFRFIKATHPLTLETIIVAKADKQSSHDYEPYLAQYEELRNRCLSMFERKINL